MYSPSIDDSRRMPLQLLIPASKSQFTEISSMHAVRNRVLLRDSATILCAAEPLVFTIKNITIAVMYLLRMTDITLK
jgi:hypothetical protein